MVLIIEVLKPANVPLTPRGAAEAVEGTAHIPLGALIVERWSVSGLHINERDECDEGRLDVTFLFFAHQQAAGRGARVGRVFDAGAPEIHVLSGRHLNGVHVRVGADNAFGVADDIPGFDVLREDHMLAMEPILQVKH